MSNSLVALGVQTPQINSIAQFDQSQGNAINAKSQQMAQARQGLEWVGSMALGAMGGKMDGQADPEKWGQGLKMLAGQGVDASVIEALQSRPDLAPVIARASLDTMQQLSIARDERDYELALRKFDLSVSEAAEARAAAAQPKPGFRTLSAEEVTAAGLPAGSYQVGPDLRVYPIGGGGQTINVNSASEVGTIPQGYELYTDPQTGGRSMRLIPGGPAAADAAAAADKTAAKDQRTATTANVVVQDIDRAIQQITSNPMMTTGIGAQATGGIGGSPARDVAGLLDTVKANAGFAELQAMRDSSPTGGALGQVTERELAFLQSTIGSLDQAQSKEQLVRNLERVKKAYQDIVDGPGAAAPSGGIDDLLDKYR